MSKKSTFSKVRHYKKVDEILTCITLMQKIYPRGEAV